MMKITRMPVRAAVLLAGVSLAAAGELAAVRCTSARNCWAVGFYGKGDVTFNEALHWNGTRWSAG